GGKHAAPCPAQQETRDTKEMHRELAAQPVGVHMTRLNLRKMLGAGLLVILICTVASAQEQAAVRHTLPANTVVAIRTIDIIDSKTAAADTEFRATVDDAVIDGDVTIVPVGAPAFLKVMQVQQPAPPPVPPPHTPPPPPHA